MIPAALQRSEVKNFIKGLGKSGDYKTTHLLKTMSPHKLQVC